MGKVGSTAYCGHSDQGDEASNDGKVAETVKDDIGKVAGAALPSVH
jgi:hypothetical protein